MDPRRQPCVWTQSLDQRRRPCVWTQSLDQRCQPCTQTHSVDQKRQSCIRIQCLGLWHLMAKALSMLRTPVDMGNSNFDRSLESRRAALEREVHPYRWALHLSSLSLEPPRILLLRPALKFFLCRENKMYRKSFNCFETKSCVKNGPVTCMRICRVSEDRKRTGRLSPF